MRSKYIQMTQEPLLKRLKLTNLQGLSRSRQKDLVHRVLCKAMKRFSFIIYQRELTIIRHLDLTMMRMDLMKVGCQMFLQYLHFQYRYFS